MSKISQLHYSLGTLNLEIPSLEIADEGVTAVVGPSGSGKTTFFRILLGLHQPTHWSWEFKGQQMAQLDITERRLGVVFQNYELFPHLTAEENILLIMRSRNNLNAESQKTLEHFKQKLKLEKCWTTKAKHLSGGEQQRIALLRAVLSAPQMILLDEPFSALDPELKQEAYDLVKGVLNEIKVPALMITHNRGEAQFFTHRVIEFNNGRVLNAL